MRSGTRRGINCDLRAGVFYMLLQHWEIPLSHCPDLVHVEAEVFVHEDVS